MEHDAGQMSLATSHTRNESTTDKYRDMITQKMITTVVDPRVSFREGNETFFSSPLTSLRNSLIDRQILVTTTPRQ